MDLRRLRYFIAVAEAGNISKAAQKIFLTQPALSRQIKALEDEIGQPLLERQAHSVRLTPTGEALLIEARDLLQHADQALERVRACGQSLRLRVGYAPSLASGLLSYAVESFTQKHSGIGVELFDASSLEMLEGLQDGTLDVAITVAPERDTRGLHWCPLTHVRWQLAVSLSHPLATASEVSAAQVAAEPLLVFNHRAYPEYWSLLANWLRERGHSPAIRGEYDGISSLLAAVAAGLGVAVVTDSVAGFQPERVRFATLAAAPAPLAIAAGYREGADRNKPLAVFIEELRYAATSLEP